MLEEIIEDILAVKADINKKDLIDQVMAKVQEEGPFSKKELQEILEELNEVLNNYY